MVVEMPDVVQHYHYKAAEMAWKIVSPILIIMGTCGNILTIVVLTRRKSRNSTTSIFLTALAVSDLLTLNTGLMRQWIKYVFDVDIREDLTVLGCKCHWFVVYIVTQFSSWMLICVTVERVLATWLPYKGPRVCSMKCALVYVAVIFCSLLVLNSHYLYGFGTITTATDNATEVVKCVPKYAAYDRFMLYEWAWIDMCVFYLIPMAVLVVGNGVIIYKFLNSQRKSRSAVAPSSVRSQTQYRRNTSSITVTLMVVSFVFVVCITPIVVYPIGEPYWKVSATSHDLAVLFCWETFANLMMYLNSTLNCALYFLSATKFRNEVKRLLFCYTTSADSETFATQTRTQMAIS